MSVFKRTATVAYDGGNFSILSVESISSATPEEILADDFRSAYATVLGSSGSNSTRDAEPTDVLLYDFEWALLLFQGDFPTDKQSPETILQGFLVVPIQFSTTLWQYVNYTINPEFPEEFALPYDLETTASGAQSTYRALAAPWTVFLFMSITGVSVFWATLLVLYSVLANSVVPNTSSFAEIDSSSKSLGLSNPANQFGVMDYSSMLRHSGLGNATSNAIAAAIKDHIIRVAEMTDPVSKTNFLVLVTRVSTAEPWKRMSQLRNLTRDHDYL